MAPAANANRYGKIGTTNEAIKIVNPAPIGSTIPDSIPYINDLFFDNPELFNGIEIIAPSGKF